MSPFLSLGGREKEGIYKIPEVSDACFDTTQMGARMGSPREGFCRLIGYSWKHFIAATGLLFLIVKNFGESVTRNCASKNLR
jgi:hypothetical protein